PWRLQSDGSHATIVHGSGQAAPCATATRGKARRKTALMDMTHTSSDPRRQAGAGPQPGPCLMVIFGAAGDLTKRLLMPAIYNLRCDGLLPERFAIIGLARDELNTESFRARMSQDIRTFNTRKEFDAAIWQGICDQLYYQMGTFDDPGAFARLGDLVKKLDGELQTGGNILFYMATPPSVFGLISAN